MIFSDIERRFYIQEPNNVVRQSRMQKGLLIFFLEALLLFSFVSISVFYSLNEINELINPKLVKPLWKIITFGILFGLVFSIAHIVSSGKE
jgi:hypothetical protein